MDFVSVKRVDPGTEGFGLEVSEVGAFPVTFVGEALVTMMVEEDKSLGAELVVNPAIEFVCLEEYEVGTDVIVVVTEFVSVKRVDPGTEGFGLEVSKVGACSEEDEPLCAGAELVVSPAIEFVCLEEYAVGTV